MLHVTCRLLTIVLFISTAWVGTAFADPPPEPKDTGSRAATGDSHIRTRAQAPAEGEPDAGLPPIKLVLRADDHGHLKSVHLGHKKFARGNLAALQAFLIDILGDDPALNSIRASFEAEIDGDDNLRYEYVVDVIQAITSYEDEDGNIVRLIERINFMPRKKTPRPEPAAADPDDPASVPESELTKPPPKDTIVIELTKEGFVDAPGKVLPIKELPNRLAREREKLESMGKKPSEVTVMVLVDHDCLTGTVQQLIKICQDHKFERFSLRAREKKQASDNTKAGMNGDDPLFAPTTHWLPKPKIDIPDANTQREEDMRSYTEQIPDSVAAFDMTLAD